MRTVGAAEPPTGERLGLIVVGGLACAVWSTLYDVFQLPPRPPGTVGLAFGGDVLPMLLVPAAFARFVLRRPLREFGFAWPGWRAGASAAGLAFLVLLPFPLLLSGRTEFQAYYPSPAFPPAREHLVGLSFLWTLHHAPQLFALEFLMRGFLLQPLARSFGLPIALVATGLPYVVLHASKPPLEWAQAAVAAVAFGVAAWRTRSFLPAFGAHWAVAVSMDVACLVRAGGFH
jgi:membrane protease YdiL (CAAX protease family)